MKKIIIFLLAFQVLFWGSVCAEDNKVIEYPISTNDLLEISVYDEPDLCKTVRVSADGTITYPLVGTIAVAGLTTKGLEEKMTELLIKDYLVNPQVNVFIKEFTKISVLGQVKNPGAYELKAGLTVVDAIALAGGLTDIADSNGTKVIRIHKGKKKTIGVPVGSILKGGDRTQDVPLQTGDTVVVPESLF
jgi:polysaccharide export outer membrane protein